jgi:outer membrane biosynthesis protein TonB
VQRSDHDPQRLLRVVLVFRGEPLEERSFPLEEAALLGPRPTRITVGQGGDDTFAIPEGGLPSGFPLLRAVGEEFILSLTEGMTGELHLGDESMTVAEFFAAGRGISANAADVPTREQVIGPEDWGIVALDPEATVAVFFEFLPLPTEATELRPRSTLAAMRAVPLWGDPFMQQALGLAAVLCLAVLALVFLAWDPTPRLVIEPAQAMRLLRSLAGVRPPQGEQAGPGQAQAYGGIAGQLLLLQERRLHAPLPLLSDDEAPAPLVSAPLEETDEGQEAPEPVKAAPVQPAPVKPAPQPAPAPAPIKPAPVPAPAKPAPVPAPAKPAPVPAPAKPVPPPPEPARPAPTPASPAPPRPGRLVVLSGAPTGQGALTRAQLDKVITFHQDEVAACFRREMAQRPMLSGKLVLAFSVDAIGALTEARIEGSTLKSPTLEDCLLKRARTWRFPASRGMTRDASVPFVFRVSP